MRPDTAPGVNVRSYYDRFMFDEVIDAYYGQSDFHNFGLWSDTTPGPVEACLALVDALGDLALPDPRRVLEVGCGKGATTRALRARWPSAAITAIDVSETQLRACRRNCPDATFMLMDACDMTFEDASFDLVISIEAAFHFPSRARFLTGARRVLVPGGRLVLQDVLHHRSDAPPPPNAESALDYLEEAEILPAENYLSGTSDYEQVLRDAGFARCRFVDVTMAGPGRFYKDFIAYLGQRETQAGRDREHLRRLRLGARLFARRIHHCLLVSADATG